MLSDQCLLRLPAKSHNLLCLQNQSLFSRIRANVVIDSTECINTLSDLVSIVRICQRVRFLATMSILASISSMLKIQYFQQVVGHTMKSLSTCTYIYTIHVHDLVESQCSPRKPRFGAPSLPTYLVKPECSAQGFI